MDNLIVQMSDYDKNNVKSGVYKITFPNGKIYIGISNNIHRRMNEHNCDYRNNIPIEHAIKKYGPITEYEILEEIDPLDRAKMCERERYWIDFFHSNNKEIGYNLTDGGDGAEVGSKNLQAKFTEEEIQQIYWDLANDLNISMEELAIKWNICYTGLSGINNGKRYWHPNIKYPIRTAKMNMIRKRGANHSNAIFSEEIIQQAYLLLEDESLELVDISNQLNIPLSHLRRINRGAAYIHNDVKYPIRKLGKGSKSLTYKQVEEIYHLIIHSDKSLTEIARLYNVPSKTISGINCGSTYRKEDFTYPLREKAIGRYKNKPVSTIFESGE